MKRSFRTLALGLALLLVLSAFPKAANAQPDARITPCSDGGWFVTELSEGEATRAGKAGSKALSYYNDNGVKQ